MADSVAALDLREQAASAAAAAAERAGVRISSLDDIGSINEATRLFNTIWAVPDDNPLISSATLRALSHSNNYIYAAYDQDQMVGTIVGFVGFHDEGLQLHSHMLGVSPMSQGKRIGFALKQHQRAWAVAHGIETVTWTFDPLVRRNAYFNISKLGASIAAYYPSFYGRMTDGINGDDETDRVLVEWQLGSARAVDASVSALIDPDVEFLSRSGVPVALEVGVDGGPTERLVSGERLLVQVPADIVEVRRIDAALSQRWRMVLRSVLNGALNDGFETVAMSRSGYYVLERTT